MLFSDTYLTIQQPSEGLFKDRGSKFISYAFPVNNETEIKTHLATLQKEHHGANHHCYAWRLGADKSAWRANDDGEPSNSAGKPILGQIQSNDLTNILIVVVRYFGGTLLGVGGLIHAYREAAAQAIRNSKIIEKHILDEYKVEFTFEQMNSIMRLLKELECKIISQNCNESCEITFYIRKQNNESLFQQAQKIQGVKLHYLRTT
jgi:uncharacterized YigZ family protein